MTLALRRALRRALVCLLLVGAAPALAGDLPDCQPPARYVAWPEGDPLWQLCVLRPRHSAGPAGGGLELRDVFFRGRRVLERADVPSLAVRHLGEARGDHPCRGRCFDTWSHQELPFGADGQVADGWLEPRGGAITSCDRARDDRPAASCPWGEAWECSPGVALEAGDDLLRLTSEVRAGWYRYSLRWLLHRDGRLETQVGALAEAGSCAPTAHHHEVTWRFDFDLGELRRDLVTTPNGDPLRTATRRSRAVDGDDGWRILDPKSGRGYRLVPGPEDLPHPPGELLVTTYGGWQSPGGCAAEPFGDITGEALIPSDRASADPVLWYRARAFVDPSAPYRCAPFGPTLIPIGHWGTAAEEELFSDGFESGDTAAWSERQPPKG